MRLWRTIKLTAGDAYNGRSGSILTNSVHSFGRQRALIAAREGSGRGEAPLSVDVQEQDQQQGDETESRSKERGGLHGNCSLMK